MNKHTQDRIAIEGRSIERCLILLDEFRTHGRDAQCIADLEARAAKCSRDAFEAAEFSRL
jgi:hypothetical protein